MKRTARITGVALLFIVFLADAPHVRDAVSDALRLCAVSVIPALFPFLVVTRLLISLGFAACAAPWLSTLMTGLYCLPGTAGGALLLGLLGGYPIGARAAADLFRLGLLTKNETERLLTFCNNANPAFFISVLGAGVFRNVRWGVWLMMIHIASALLTGLVFRAHSVPRDVPPDVSFSDDPPAFFPAFVDAVGDAALTMLKICAFVTFFAVLVRPLKVWNHPAAVPLMGLLELFSLTPLLTPDASGFLLAAVCTGWGGLSALGQTAAVLEHSGLSMRPCVAGKAVQGILSGLLAALAVRFL